MTPLLPAGRASPTPTSCRGTACRPLIVGVAGALVGAVREPPTEASIVGARRWLALTCEIPPGFRIARGDRREGEAPPRPYGRNTACPSKDSLRAAEITAP
jgi:hypothetical protein